MKRKNILSVIVGGCLVLGGLTSCEDFLTLYPTNQITEEEFWEDKGDLESAMMACYVRMTNDDLQQKVLHWGEGRSDNSVVQDQSNSSIVNLKAGILEDTEGMFSWSPFYTAINYCNKVIENVPAVAERDPSFNSGEQQQYIVEAKTLRALNYFYLVRAFRDVPVVLQSISTDAEAFQAQTPQTPGLQVLDTLIADLDSIKDMGVLTYASSSNRCGRITRLATYTLQADMYLWRACMLKNADAKGYRFDTLSASITEADADAQSQADLNKVIEYCDYVINEMKDRKNSSHFGNQQDESDQQEDMFPLILQENAFDGATDEVFSEIFSSKNSDESIFELQFDGSSIVNSTWTATMTSTASGVTGQMYSINPSLYVNIGQTDPEVGFGRSDMRALENTRIEGSQTTYLYFKGSQTSVDIESMTNMIDGTTSTNTRADGSNAFNWIIYRLSDVMLMKAEAIARLSSISDEQYQQAWLMVNAIFQRSNPSCTTEAESVGGDAPVSTRCDENFYSNNKTASTLLSYVYRERQREFLGEYKRWFDLVRYAEAENSTENALSMMGASRAVQTRLRTLNSFYNPITEDEMKINSNLVQNPAWNDATIGSN